jgi:uncharacterized membrane protein YfcA
MEALITTTAVGIAGAVSSLIIWIFTTKVPVRSRTVFAIGISLILAVVAAAVLWMTGQLDVTSLGTLMFAVIGAAQATYAVVVKQIQEGSSKTSVQTDTGEDTEG